MAPISVLHFENRLNGVYQPRYEAIVRIVKSNAERFTPAYIVIIAMRQRIQPRTNAEPFGIFSRGKRSIRGPLHLRVGVALVPLVKSGHAACSERSPHNHEKKCLSTRERPNCAVTGGRSQNRQKAESRLGEFEIVRKIGRGLRRCHSFGRTLFDRIAMCEPSQPEARGE